MIMMTMMMMMMMIKKMKMVFSLPLLLVMNAMTLAMPNVARAIKPFSYDGFWLHSRICTTW